MAPSFYTFCLYFSFFHVQSLGQLLVPVSTVCAGLLSTSAEIVWVLNFSPMAHWPELLRHSHFCPLLPFSLQLKNEGREARSDNRPPWKDMKRAPLSSSLDYGHHNHNHKCSPRSLPAPFTSYSLWHFRASTQIALSRPAEVAQSRQSERLSLTGHSLSNCFCRLLLESSISRALELIAHAKLSPSSESPEFAALFQSLVISLLTELAIWELTTAWDFKMVSL